MRGAHQSVEMCWRLLWLLSSGVIGARAGSIVLLGAPPSGSSRTEFDAHAYLRTGDGARGLAAYSLVGELALPAAVEWACAAGCCVACPVGGLSSFVPALVSAGAAAVVVTDSRSLVAAGGVAGAFVFRWQEDTDLGPFPLPVVEAFDPEIAPLLASLAAVRAGAAETGSARSARTGVWAELASAAGVANPWLAAWRGPGLALRLLAMIGTWHNGEQAFVRLVGFLRLDGQAGLTVPQLITAFEAALACVRLALLVDCPLDERGIFNIVAQCIEHNDDEGAVKWIVTHRGVSHAARTLFLVNTSPARYYGGVLTNARALFGATLPLANTTLLILLLFALSVGMSDGIIHGHTYDDRREK
ncbi:hypothetical protein T492DRAFT_848280 [Pavlovales sp. CCMP2436]|nr:hypothetical protein T492DRAFT_848280 [Pavlovales sp. CCMP2436]